MIREDLKDKTYIFLINSNWVMSGGKVAAQVANVACQLPKVKLKPLQDPCTLVLSASEEFMIRLLEVYEKKLKIKYTVDAGYTEFTIGALTCIGWKYKDWAEPLTTALPLFTVK